MVTAILVTHSNVLGTLHTKDIHHKATGQDQATLRKGIPPKAKAAIHHRAGDRMGLTWVESLAVLHLVGLLVTHSIQE